MSDTSKQNRIGLVQKYIENNLSEDLTINKLAKLVSISSFYFQRLFFRELGESVSGYIRSRRLERAAKLVLKKPDKSLINIALDCGFESHSAFSKAFKQHFKMSPSKFSTEGINKNKKLSQHSRPYLKTMNNKNFDLVVDFVELPTMWFQFKEQIGVYEGVFFPDRKAMTKDLIKLTSFNEQGLISICGGYRSSPKAFTDEMAIGNYGGLFNKEPNRIWSQQVEEIEAGKWAIFPHFGKFENLHMTWNKIYRNWLPNNNLTLKNSWSLETYITNSNDNISSNHSAQIYIQLEK